MCELLECGSQSHNRASSVHHSHSQTTSHHIIHIIIINSSRPLGVQQLGGHGAK